VPVGGAAMCGRVPAPEGVAGFLSLPLPHAGNRPGTPPAGHGYQAPISG